MAAAAESMRRILVESARRKKRLKHGGEFQRVSEDIDVPLHMPDEELIALDEALNRLAKVEERAANVVKLCFFVGMTQEEAAREMGMSRATAERLWSFARAWLFREMKKLI
jgi:RNA polymerase sigma factor (TIGR02999 family)